MENIKTIKSDDDNISYKCNHIKKNIYNTSKIPCTFKM